MPFDSIRSRVGVRPACTQAVVAAIIQDPEPVRRNYAITRSYHELTRAVGERMGTGDIPWTGFAAWASETAGEFIRRDWLAPELHGLLSRAKGPVGLLYNEMDLRVRTLVAAGNLKVYAEIAPRFVELLAVLDSAGARRARLRRALIAGLRAGPVQSGGQAALAQALDAYLEAAECVDDRRRAQLVLLANLLIGYHEQYRLQPEIAGSLGAASVALPAPRGLWQRALQRRFIAIVRRFSTRFMQIRLPGAPLKLGEDVPPLGRAGMFPEALARVDLPALARLLEAFDRTPDTVEGSAARDWAALDDRMNYLVDLFRTRQRDPRLWASPLDGLSAGRRG